MENASTKEVIKGFDLTKFVLSFFVVAIHTELFGEYIYPIVRIAVPLYFIISSYIFFENLKGKDSKEKNQILKKIYKKKFIALSFLVYSAFAYHYHRKRIFFDGVVRVS